MSQILGKQLREIRQSRGISLEEISQKTHIRVDYLESIEIGEHDSLPSQTHLRGFLRLYANELGVKIEELKKTALQIPPSPEPDKLESETPEIAAVTQEEEGIEEKQTDVLQSESGSGKSIVAPSEVAYEQFGQKPETRQSTPIPEQFIAIGKKIEERRELLSLSLEDIENHLHIRINYLKAIESGNFEQLPSPVQAKGMIINYATFLNLDSEQVLLQYAEGLQQKRMRLQEQSAATKKQPAKELSTARLRLKNFFSLDLLVIGLLFFAFAGFVIWGINRILSVNSQQAQETEIPEVSDILLATGSPTPQLETSAEATSIDEGSELTPEEMETPLFTPMPNNSPINIVIIPLQRVWVQVTSDNEIAFVGRLIPGNAYEYSADTSAEILTGNAGALQIYFNDQGIGSPGLIGQVVTLSFTRNGLVLPTPTNTPTVTNTPQDTPTPTATPSSTLTITPTP